jgi:hypothetical protein
MPASQTGRRMAHLEGAYEQVGHRLTAIDLRFDALDRKIDLVRDALDKKIDQRIETLDKKIDQRIEALDQSLSAKIDQRFMWTIGVVVSTWLTTLAAIELHR